VVSGKIEVTGVLRTWGVWYWLFFGAWVGGGGGGNVEGDEWIYCRRVL